MRNKNLLFLIIIFIFWFTTLGIARAQDLGSSELIKNAKTYDRNLVTYSGEVIGDLMERGQFTWVNLNDGDNAIGIWVPTDLISNINFTGNYKTQGDILRVTGEFHAICLEHGGDLDLHAQAVQKIQVGRLISKKINFDKIKLSLILLGVLILIWTLSLLKKK